jgi:hypothetical protein
MASDKQADEVLQGKDSGLLKEADAIGIGNGCWGVYPVAWYAVGDMVEKR